MYLNLITNPDLTQSYVTSSDPSTFTGWSLSSIASTPTIYQFNLNNESSDITVENDFKLYQNYQKYPSYNFGNMKYKKGKLTTIPYTSEIGNSNNEYIIDVDLLNILVSFINDKKAKLITLPNGESFKVVCMDASYKYMDNIVSQPYTISFSYIQISN